MAGTQGPLNPNEVVPFNSIKDEWLIQYSRFFNFPSLPSTFASLRPLVGRCRTKNSHGIWVISSSIGSLQVGYDSNAHGVVLTVSFGGKVYEEHYISRLHFSWPQVACLEECPMRGSRVVFASYIDGLGQVHKFAMRFSSCSDSQKFINSLKESLKDITNVGLASCQYGSEASFLPEFISSNRNHESATEGLRGVNPVADYVPPIHPLTDYEIMLHSSCKETMLEDGSKATSATLPPSFTALLSDSFTEAEHEPPKLLEAVCNRSQITACMTSSSFNDMLTKLEMVIHELGGDLAL